VIDHKKDGRINVAYIIDTISCDTAGTQKQLLETIKRIDSGSFCVHLVCLWQSEWMIKNILPCPCTVLGYKGFLKFNFFAVIARLRKFYREQNIKIVQTFFEDSIFVAYLSALPVRPRPVLISSRRDMGLGENNQPWYHHLYGMVLPLVNRSFDGIIANSEQVRQYVAKRERVSLEKIMVVRNGVDLPGIPVSLPDVFKQADNNALWVGLVASLTPVKRHDLFLHALALCMHKLTIPVRVLLLGEGPERKSLEQLCTKLHLDGSVLFQGVVRDVASYLQHLDICVLCSDREGLSNAILEYMACAKPVIATAVGGNTELVNDQNGILVPPGDPAALADALADLAMNAEKRKKMGTESLKMVMERFSWQKSMNALEGYYREVVR